MRSEICLSLAGLFPPGALSEDDDGAEEVIAACAEEFEMINALAQDVTSSTPAEGILKDRFQAMGFAEQYSKRIEDTEHGSFCVSNNVGHLNALIPGVAIEVIPLLATMRVKGLLNTRRLARAGTLSAGAPLSVIARDDKGVRTIETTKHAHVRAVYEEVIDA